MTSPLDRIKFLGFDCENTQKLAGKDFPMKSMSIEHTKSGDVELCRGWLIESPGSFYVIKHSNWELLEKYQKLWTEFYEEREEGTRRKKLDRFTVSFGAHLEKLFVAVKHLREEWYRARVLSIFLYDGKERLKVQLLDYGEVLIISPKLVRRIPEAILKRVPAFAIQCSINVDDAFPADHVWADNETRIFFELMKDCRYQVKFAGHDLPPKPFIWKCEIHLVKYENGHDGDSEFRRTDKVSVNQLFLGALKGESRSDVERAIQTEMMKNDAYEDSEIPVRVKITSAQLTGINQSVNKFDGLVLSGD